MPDLTTAFCRQRFLPIDESKVFGFHVNNFVSLVWTSALLQLLLLLLPLPDTASRVSSLAVQSPY
jgi:hypothetical protein